MSGKRRLATLAAAGTLAATAGLLVTAASAHATAGECTTYLENQGYSGQQYQQICVAGATNVIGSEAACWDALTLLGVPSSTATTACDKANDPS